MKVSRKFHALIASMLFAASVGAVAQDALQVMPTRLMLTDQSSGELTLVNKGTNPGTYRILLRNIRTDDFGKFEEAEEAKEGELFANKMIRFSPRRVTVEPGSFQKVRVMVRKPKSLADGEYRTHMVFQTLPEQSRNVLDESASDDVDIAVQTIVEISIPIIVRHGKLNAEIQIGEANASSDNMLFTLNRSGNRSIYGDVEVFISSGPQKDTRVGFARGLSVYYPNAIRKVEVPLAFPEGISPGNQQLELRFSEDPEYGGNLSSKKVIKLK